MKKKIDGRPLELWNVGDLLDYLDKCIRDSINNVNDLDFEESNTYNRISTVLTTPDFDKELKTMTKAHETCCLICLKQDLKELFNLNASEKPNGLKQLHIFGTVFIEYRHWGNNTLIVDLMRFEVTDDDYEDLRRILDCSFTAYYQKKTCFQCFIYHNWTVEVNLLNYVYIFSLRYYGETQLQFGVCDSKIEFLHHTDEYGKDFQDKITSIIEEVMSNYVKLK